MRGRLLSPHFALWGTCAALGTALVYVVATPSPALQVPASRAPTILALAEPPPAFVAPPRESFASISDRPLFDVTRQRYVPPPKLDSEKAPPLPKMFLVGVIIDAQTRIAMLKAPDAALAKAVSVGEDLEGWQVSEIEPDRIVLKAGMKENEIRLDANKVSPAVAPAHETATTQQKTTQEGRGLGQ